jgi:pimeloyl-ACP methyl ester carboxylesterase
MTGRRIAAYNAIIFGFFTTGILFGDPRVNCAAEPPKKALPLPGEVFSVDGYTAFLILPAANGNDAAAAAHDKGSKTAVPWVWYAPTLHGLPGPEEKWMFERFLKAGIAVAGIDVGESYGCPAGRKLYSALYKELTGRRGLAAKPVMLGRSRGGLMTLAWAAENAEKVAAFAGIYPVCDLRSYPGVDKACGSYDMTAAQLTAHLAEHNPIDRLAPLAKAKVPLFAIHGDRDTLVPLAANSGEMKKRYDALGGRMQLVVPTGQGHNMWSGFFQCEELVTFVIAEARRANEAAAAPPGRPASRSPLPPGEG